MGEKVEGFEAKGLKVAAVTYDSVAALKNFSDRAGIRYPMLSDEGSKTIRAFGILNESIPEDNPFYGVPYPGTYIVDAEGRVKSKYFEPDYRERFTAAAILLKEFNEGGVRGSEIGTPHLKLRTSTSNERAYAGSRITLVLEMELSERMHVYAPGVQAPYIPIEWKLDASKAWNTLPPALPAARTLRLEAIKETVPVFEGKVRLTRDIVVGQTAATAPALTPDGELTVKGSLRYQACDDKVCYTPRTIPLEWRIKVNPPDRQRVPAPLRGKLR